MRETEKNRTLLLTTVALGTLLNPLNSSLMSVALARFQEAFQLSFAELSWIVSIFYLASAIGQPVMGKLGDLLGRKRFFLIGLSLVAVSSVLAPFSPSFSWLIAFRAIQAFGSSAVYPSGMGIIRKSVTEKQARAIGVISTFNNTSAAFGPPIGGLLIHYGDWPAIFLINFPFIILSFALALKVLPADEKGKREKIHIDIGGIILFSAAVVGWLLFLLSAKEAFSWWKLAIGLVFTVLFYRHESRVQEPFVNVLELKKNVRVSMIYLQNIFINIAFYTVYLGVPVYLQRVQMLDVKATGLMMLSIAASATLVIPVAGRWIDRSGSKPVLLSGASALLIGTGLLFSVSDNSSPVWIFAVLAVLGASSGFINLGIQTALYARIRRSDTGIASGLLMTARYIGTILASVLLGIAFQEMVSTARLHGLVLVNLLLGAFVWIFAVRMERMESMPVPLSAPREK